MFTTCLDFGSWTWVISVLIAAWLQPLWRQSTLYVWVPLSFYATRWPVLPKCMQLTLVSWYVANMLCCHWWMLSLSDALPMQSYPSKVWVFCQCGRAAQHICLVSYRSMFLHEIGGILWLTLWRCWLHSVECSVYFSFWSGFWMAESWARRLSLCLACKPFPGLCACTRAGRWCASVVAIRSLSLFTNRAARSTV